MQNYGTSTLTRPALAAQVATVPCPLIGAEFTIAVYLSDVPTGCRDGALITAGLRAVVERLGLAEVARMAEELYRADLRHRDGGRHEDCYAQWPDEDRKGWASASRYWAEWLPVSELVDRTVETPVAFLEDVALLWDLTELGDEPGIAEAHLWAALDQARAEVTAFEITDACDRARALWDGSPRGTAQQAEARRWNSLRSSLAPYHPALVAR